jgi:hypothetical protein
MGRSLALYATRKVAGGSLLVAALIGCGKGGPDARTQATVEPTAGTVAVAMTRKIPEKNVLTVKYAGTWEFVSNQNDGRFQGESARSFHSGDSITVVFSGNRFRLYGIRGRNGGVASVIIPGRSPARINFYAPVKETHVLLYDSGPLNGLIQTAGIVVTTPPPPRQEGYVNIDEMEAVAH